MSIEHDPGILVAVPAPGVRGADGVHDAFLQYLRQRTAPDIERGERQHVHANVVVLVHAARLVARPRGPFTRLVARPVGPVGLAPQRAFPVAHLAQQVVPGDGAVVRGFKQIEEIGRAEGIRLVARRGRSVNLDRRDILAHRVVDAPDQASVIGQSHHAGKKTLGHAVGHVHPQRISPFGDDVAVVDDEARGIAAFPDGPDGIAERFAAEGLIVVEFQIARRPGLAGDGKVDRIFQQRRADAGLGRRLVLPRRIGVINGGSVVAGLSASPGRGQYQQKCEQGGAMIGHGKSLHDMS